MSLVQLFSVQLDLGDEWIKFSVTLDEQPDLWMCFDVILALFDSNHTKVTGNI